MQRSNTETLQVLEDILACNNNRLAFNRAYSFVLFFNSLRVVYIPYVYVRHMQARQVFPCEGVITILAHLRLFDSI